MKRTVAIVLGIAMVAMPGFRPALAGTWNNDYTGWTDSRGFRAFPGETVRGSAVLDAENGQPSHLSAIVTGIESGFTGTSQLALSRSPCTELRRNPESTEDLRPIGEPLDVAPDGTASIDQDDDFTERQLLRARSLSVYHESSMAEQRIASCARLDVDVASTDDPDGVLLIASHLGDRYGGARFLVWGMFGPRFAEVLDASAIRLMPDTEYALALSRRSCRELTRDADGSRLARVAAFRTDASGSGFVTRSGFDENTFSSKHRSLVVASRGSRGSEIAACGYLITIETDHL